MLVNRGADHHNDDIGPAHERRLIARVQPAAC